MMMLPWCALCLHEHSTGKSCAHYPGGIPPELARALPCSPFLSAGGGPPEKRPCPCAFYKDKPPRDFSSHGPYFEFKEEDEEYALPPFLRPQSGQK